MASVRTFNPVAKLATARSPVDPLKAAAEAVDAERNIEFLNLIHLSPLLLFRLPNSYTGPDSSDDSSFCDDADAPSGSRGSSAAPGVTPSSSTIQSSTSLPLGPTMRASNAAAMFGEDVSLENDEQAPDEEDETTLKSFLLELKRDIVDFKNGLTGRVDPNLDPNLAGLETSFWLDQAKMQRYVLASLTNVWLGITVFQLLYDFLQDRVTLGWHPRTIRLIEAESVYLKLLAIRLAICAVLLYTKRTKFFTGTSPTADPPFFTAHNKLLYGLCFIQILEFVAASVSVDSSAGIHCTLMLIIFNYTPIRVAYKAPPCFLNLLCYAVYIVSNFVVGTSDSKLWVLHRSADKSAEEDSSELTPEHSAPSPSAALTSTITICILFFIVQVYFAYTRERSLVVNHMSQAIGENQEICLGHLRAKNQELLNNMLPAEVSKGNNVDSAGHAAPNVESYLDVTVLFCMINDFRLISKTMNSDELVQILNIVYSTFDSLVDDTKIYKVETIGEVYMMAAGCPKRNVWHAEYAADMALSMINAIADIREQLKTKVLRVGEVPADVRNSSVFRKKLDMVEEFNIKVGLNTGGVTAGVIGDTCQRFKLFGDTVNTASRMESNSIPGWIMTSDSTFKILIKSTYKRYNFKRRGVLPIKGKGNMHTYFLCGEGSNNYSEEWEDNLRLGSNEFSLSRRIAEIQRQEREETGSADAEMATNREHDQLMKMIEMDHEHTADSDDDDSGIDITLTRAVLSGDEDEGFEKFLATKEVKLRHALMDRKAPQLSLSRTLLLIFGQEMSIIKPSPRWDTWLETQYSQNAFFRERTKLRRVCLCFFTIFTAMAISDTFLLKRQIAVAVVRYGLLLPTTAGAYVFTYSNHFFFFQQTALTVLFGVMGLSVVMLCLYKAYIPNHGFILIFINLVFNMELMFFMNRIVLNLLVILFYIVVANVMCVSFGEGMLETSGVPKFDLTELGNIMCCSDDDPDMISNITNSTGDSCNSLWDFYGVIRWHENSLGLEAVVENFLYTEMSHVQTLMPKTVIYHAFVLLVFFSISIYPSWLSNYFSRVSFNRYVEIEKRKIELSQETAESSKQLCKLLPPSVVMTLRDNSEDFLAEMYRGITVLFVDMVGFTNFSAQLDPDELVMFLNHMYSKFDTVLERFSLYKVEIIGDALFAVAGCPSELRDPFHASRALCAAHGLLEQIELICEDLELDVRIRIGVHSGDSVAGVVGLKDPRFHLFGETVNCAEKIESTGLAGQVHCSEATRKSVFDSSNSLIPSKRYDQFFKFALRTPERVDEMFANVPETEATIKEKEALKNSIADAAAAAGKSYFVTLKKPLSAFTGFDKKVLRELSADTEEKKDNNIMKSSRTSGKGKKTHKSSRRSASTKLASEKRLTASVGEKPEAAGGAKSQDVRSPDSPLR
jgi:class 3 adenylate cyclase